MKAPAAVSPKGALILGGAHGSLEIARSLGRRGIPVWLVTAENPLAGLSRYVERNVSWPGPAGDGAARFLVELGHRHSLEDWVLFAGSDADMRFVAQNHATLGAVFTLTTEPWDKIRFAYDKRLMDARAAELGIARPSTRYPRSRDDLAHLGISFPVILKPTVHETRNAFIDAKAWRADDQRTLAARYDEAKALVGADAIMIQELIPGDGATQFSYAAVWDRGRPIGALVARRCRQYPINFGFTSTLVETVERPEVEAAATRFLASLDFSGLAEIEFKYDARDGSYKILDVNARAWTWMALGAAAGIDFPGVAIPPRARPARRAGHGMRRRTLALFDPRLRGFGCRDAGGTAVAVGLSAVAAPSGGRGGFRLGRSAAGLTRSAAQRDPRGDPAPGTAAARNCRGEIGRAGYFVNRAAATACWNSVCMAEVISPSVVTEKNMPGDAQLCIFGSILLWNGAIQSLYQELVGSGR